MKTYFVTGATGVVGSRLVPELLRHPDARLKLLIRARDARELADRLDGLFDFWQVRRDDMPTRSRIEPLAGDTTAPHLGLDDETHRALATQCTHIIHAAGLVRMNLPLEEARRSAVGSARNIVALARACPNLEKLDFVSTVGVGGRLPGPIPERWLTEPRAFHNTYEQAKAEAEDFLHEETARAPLPLTVHRPSMVVGDSRDGRIISFQVFYYLCEFLSGRRTFGLYPDFGDARLDIIGCDIVAESLAAASTDPQTIGRVLHLCSGPRDSLRLEDLKHAVRRVFCKHGHAVPSEHVLPRSVYFMLARWAAALAPQRQQRALSTLPIFLDYLADSQSFDDAQYLAWLRRHGRNRPPPSSYLAPVLEFYCRAQVDRR